MALVNNAGTAHIGELGSVDAIARAKGEIYSGLGADGVALINADDAYADYWRSLVTGKRILEKADHPSLKTICDPSHFDLMTDKKGRPHELLKRIGGGKATREARS